jgi:hypothetical protein
MALRFFNIPLEPVSQRLVIDLGGQSLALAVRWNDVGEIWILDIFDGRTLEPLLLSMPLVTGCDLLAQYKFLGIKGHLVASTDGTADDPPTFQNLGAEGHLTYAVES